MQFSADEADCTPMNDSGALHHACQALIPRDVSAALP